MPDVFDQVAAPAGDIFDEAAGSDVFDRAEKSAVLDEEMDRTRARGDLDAKILNQFDEATGLASKAKAGLIRLKELPTTLQVAGAANLDKPTMRQERRAFESAMTDPAYFAASTIPGATPLQVESRFGPAAKLDTAMQPQRELQKAIAEDVARIEAELSAMPRSEAQRRLEATETTGQKFKAWLRDPVELTAGIVLESLPPSLAGAAVGGVPGVAVSSGVVTFASELLSNAAALGYDVRDPDQLQKWLNHSEDFQAAFRQAAVKSAVVGGVDGATAGATAQLLEPALKQGLKQIVIAGAKDRAIQATGGMLGEAGGSLAAGQKPDLFDVAMEGVAEIGQVESLPAIKQKQVSREGGEGSEGVSISTASNEAAKSDTPVNLKVQPTRDLAAELQAAMTKGQIAPKPAPEPGGGQIVSTSGQTVSKGDIFDRALEELPAEARAEIEAKLTAQAVGETTGAGAAVGTVTGQNVGKATEAPAGVNAAEPMPAELNKAAQVTASPAEKPSRAQTSPFELPAQAMPLDVEAAMRAERERLLNEKIRGQQQAQYRTEAEAGRKRGITEEDGLLFEIVGGIGKLPAFIPDTFTAHNFRRLKAKWAGGQGMLSSAEREYLARLQEQFPANYEDDFGADGELVRQAYDAAKAAGIEQELFARKKSGANLKLSVVLDQIEQLTGKKLEARDLWAAVIRLSNQKAARNAEEVQGEQFQMRAIEGNRPKKEKFTRVPAGAMREGDTFDVQGAQFTVQRLEYDEAGELAFVQVKDGPKFGVQNVDGDRFIHIDNGSFDAGPEHADVPVEIPQAAQKEGRYALAEEPLRFEGREADLDEIAMDLYNRPYDELAPEERGKVQVTLEHEDARAQAEQDRIDYEAEKERIGYDKLRGEVPRREAPQASGRPAALPARAAAGGTARPVRPAAARATNARRRDELAQEIYRRDYAQLSDGSQAHVRDELKRGREPGAVSTDAISQRLQELWDDRARAEEKFFYAARGPNRGLSSAGVSAMSEIRYIDGQLAILREIASAPEDMKRHWFRAFTEADTPAEQKRLQEEFRFALAERRGLGQGNVQGPAVTDRTLQQMAGEEGLENFTIVNRPQWSRNGRAVQAMTDRNGRVTINAGARGMENDATARKVIREERAHQLLASPEGRAAIRKFALEQMTDAEEERLFSMGYTGSRELLADEFIAKQARENTTIWREIVDKVRAWLASKGLAELTNDEVARAILRSLRSARWDARPTEGERYSLGESPAAGLGEQVRQAEEDLKAAIRQFMSPPEGMSKQQAREKRDAAAAKLRELQRQRLQEMMTVQVDEFRGDPEQLARHISETVDLLNAVLDDISQLKANGQAVPSTLNKFRNDLQTRLTALKGWTETEPESGARQRGGPAAGSVRRQKELEFEGATNPERKSITDWWNDVLRPWLRKFASPVPEIPLTGESAVRAAPFMRGFRLFRAETARVRREAAAKIGHVLDPLLKGEVRTREQNAALKRYHQLSNQLSRAMAQGRDDLVQRIQGQMEKLESESLQADPFNLFRLIVIYRDLWWRGTYLKTPDGKPVALPQGWSNEDVANRLQRLTAALDAHPQKAAITESLKRHYALTDELQRSILDHGEIIPEALRNPLYFPHHILDYWTGRIDRVRPSTEEDFRRYLIAPMGSGKLVQTDYLKAMYVHVADVLAHNARVDLVQKYWQRYDASPRLKEEFGEAWDKPWNLPPGYKLFAPFKKLPLRMDYVLSREVLAEKLGVLFNDGDLKVRAQEGGRVLKVDPEELHQALVAGEKIKWALPAEIADALEGIAKRERARANPGLGHEAGWPVRKIVNFWKKTKLFAPWNWLRYEYGNTLTDVVDKVMVADPGMAKFIPQAAREIVAADRQGKKSPEFIAASREGVFETITGSELGEARKLTSLPEFNALATAGEDARETVAGFARLTARGSMFREAVFRYAKFLADVERMKAGRLPVYAGAYHKSIEALGEDAGGQRPLLEGDDLIHAKAAEISLKTFGDYNSLSVVSQWLRQYLIPFHSWTDVNFRYHANQLRNIADGLRGIRGGTARDVALKYAAVRVISMLAGVGVVQALWNSVGGALAGLWDDDDDLESQLSAHDRRRAHVILGKDENGKVLVAYTPSAFGDVAEWIGGNNGKRLFLEYAKGDITLQQFISDYAKQIPEDTVNKLVQSTGPIVKGPYELASGKAVFPDVLDQRQIPKGERWYRFLGTMTDDRAVNWLRQVFDKDYYAPGMNEQLQQIILQVRRRDPEQWSYYEAREKAADWKEARTGKRFEAGAYDAPEAQALRNFRRAIYRADVAAAEHFYQRLLEFGYTSERFDASIRAQHPLSDLNREQQREYTAGLDARSRRELDLALAYYERIANFDRRERGLFPRQRAVRAARATGGARKEPNTELLRELIGR